MSEPLGHLFKDGFAVHTIAAGRPFLSDLAQELIQAYADDPVGLSQVTIYLPSRRAVRSMQSAFLDTRPGETALLLPRLRPLGDVDEEDLLVAGIPTMAETAERPPADGVERRLVLAQMVRQARIAARRGTPGWPASLLAADELAQLLDEFHTHGVSLGALEGLVGDDAVPEGAKHWQLSLSFLAVVTAVWPVWLEGQGRIDGAARRRRLMEALADSVTDADGPVIVAGSMGTIPATGRLMARVAQLDRGFVVLPGLDKALDADAWKAVDPPHPQALFQNLLKDHFGGMTRDGVAQWPRASTDGSARRAFLSLVLRPAEATDDWHRRLKKFRSEHDIAQATRGLRTAVAATEDEEAGFVALLMRETLETPGKTCTLVTPDRTLARRVQAKLAAWNVTVDDSGGTPLQGTFRGTYLRAVGRWLCAPSDPVAISAVTAHPLCRLGLSKAEHDRAGRALNRHLRGQPPHDGFDGLDRHLADGDRGWSEKRKAERALARDLVSRMKVAAGPFAAATVMLGRLQAHIECAQAMAEAPEQTGAERLWRYEDGEGLAQQLTGLLRAGDVLPDCDIDEYADIFDTLVAGPVVRPRGGHPRLAILGLLEARLQQADRVILAGLNEGVWPDGARVDPFLSRPMREELGLPSPEMIIGRSAHDFSQLAAHREVWLTRSARSGRSPAEASRWMVRLGSFARAGEAEVDDSARLRSHLAALHRHDDEVVPAGPPTPTPPVEVRPKCFSVSEIATLLRDPYAIYAKKILKLPKLEPVARGMDAAIKGTFYHAVFDKFAKDHAETPPADTALALRRVAEALFEEHGVTKALQALWRPQMEIGFETFALFDAHARGEGTVPKGEIEGVWSFTHEGTTYTIRGRADRIDIAPDGRVMVTDYKTGSVPTVKQDKLFNPQLALTALMARGGAFADAGIEKGAEAYRAAYLDSLPSKRSKTVFAKAHSIEEDAMAEHLADAEKGFLEWLSYFADPANPYTSQPRAFMVPRFDDYGHLARRGEWAGLSDEDGA